MIDEVFTTGLALIQKIHETQKSSIEKAAEIMANCFLSDHQFFVTGSGHSHTVAEEFYARAGTLAFIKPILTNELTLTEHPTKSSYLERLPGYAAILCDLYHIQKGDGILIASNSGRNAYPVEMARLAKERGAQVIAITSLAHSNAVSSRDSSGLLLKDVANVVIDNCGCLGDSALPLPGSEITVCPTSSMANAFIVQAISAQCAQLIAAAGRKPPVFVSLNCEGSEHVNDAYFEKYTRMY